MKKKLVLLLTILFTAFLNSSSGMCTGKEIPHTDAAIITTLIINANVTVVLVGDDEAKLQVAGNNAFANLITLTKNGKTLVIGYSGKRDLKDEVTIYVPAAQLTKMLINSAANVRSLDVLQNPNIDVVVNGECKIEISNTGNLNFIDTENYIFEQASKVFRHHKTAY
jgi:hypothetical protein